uniref:Uncharacterized protein n=1 Tax=Vespula pensylvanica TaxID=30213 RepID=A0A834NWR3_VESPE|nr:hypothetical protein H0235_010283 [Vespula pensylvanica]
METRKEEEKEEEVEKVEEKRVKDKPSSKGSTRGRLVKGAKKVSKNRKNQRVYIFDSMEIESKRKTSRRLVGGVNYGEFYASMALDFYARPWAVLVVVIASAEPSLRSLARQTPLCTYFEMMSRITSTHIREPMCRW